jgi:alkylation response protein AidB-like acyl-CoA dehydrogenase
VVVPLYRTDSEEQRNGDLVLRPELLDRARELVPLIRSHADQTDRERRVTDENIKALAEAGLLKLLVPRRYGGHQCSHRTALEVCAVISEACGGTGWVTGLINSAAWMTSLFSERAQDDVYGTNPEARVAGAVAPSLDTRSVYRGLIVSGKWFWTSASLHADWACLGMIAPDATQYMGLIPMRELTVEDTWFTTGMRGSGSNCVVAENVIVPEHRLLHVGNALRGEFATEHTNEAPYRAGFGAVSALVLIGPQLGLGRAALHEVVSAAPRRSITYTVYQRQSNSTAFQLQVAQAAMKLQTAELHAIRAADTIDDAAYRDERLDHLTKARIRAEVAYTAQQVTEAITILMNAHGSSAFAESNPLQRIWRDSNTAARHAITNAAIADEIYGKALLGVEDAVAPLL